MRVKTIAYLGEWDKKKKNGYEGLAKNTREEEKRFK